MTIVFLFPNFWPEFSPFIGEKKCCLVVKGIYPLPPFRDPTTKKTFLCLSSLRGDSYLIKSNFNCLKLHFIKWRKHASLHNNWTLICPWSWIWYFLNQKSKIRPSDGNVFLTAEVNSPFNRTLFPSPGSILDLVKTEGIYHNSWASLLCITPPKRYCHLRFF